MRLRERCNLSVKALWKAIFRHIFFLSMNHRKISQNNYWLFCMTCPLIFLLCSILFHKNTGSKPLKWFKNPRIRYNPQFEKLEIGYGWVKSVSGVAMLKPDRNSSIFLMWAKHLQSAIPVSKLVSHLVAHFLLHMTHWTYHSQNQFS